MRVSCSRALLHFFVPFAALTFFGSPALPAGYPVNLRCEYLDNPLGIEASAPRLSWQLESAKRTNRGLSQTAYQVLVASSPELLAKNRGDLWDSGKRSSDESIQIEYQGKTLTSRQRCYWKVKVWDDLGKPSAWSAPASWAMGLLASGDWHAHWITGSTNSIALPLFRTSFRVEKSVRRAELFICGLGFYTASLNGVALDETVLKPGWTDYRKSCLYEVHDLTKRLSQGDNVLGVMLGNGMYNVVGGRYTKFTGSFGPPKLIAQLDIEYSDGTTAQVVSDGRWKTSAGPIVFSCIYGGEDYDARKEQRGWDKPGFDAGSWGVASECQGPGGSLSSASAPSMIVRETFQARRPTQPRPGVWVYDLGQNFSGWPQLRVTGPAGATVKMITGELLDKEGLVSQGSSGGPVWFAYTLKGGQTESWHPLFSYSGFRYVQVEGAAPSGSGSSGSPQLEKLEGLFIVPQTPTVGEFSCSNPEINRVHALILAAIKSNFKTVLTDCPHREKLGWLECSHLLAGCFMYNYDCARFYEKIATDIRQAQLESGLVPDIAPEYVIFQSGFRDSPEWGSASVLAPWRAYQAYGDKRTLAAQYDTMKRYVAYLGTRAKDHIVSHGLGDWYDIGPRGPGESQLTSMGLTATGVYFQDLQALRSIASLLGKEQDAREFAALSDSVKGSFNATYFHADKNEYDRNSQTASAMPLVAGLVPDESRVAVLENLVRNIRAGGNRVTAGDVGFYYVVQALLNGGRSDVLYDMLLQTNGPGYLFQLQHNATSLTEAWDTNPGSSQNHCMLGHIEEWFYTGVLGIRPDAPAFRRVIIRPQLGGGLVWARGSYDSPYGRIGSAWERKGGRLRMEISIPPNTSATVYVPAKAPETVTESGRPAAKSPGIKAKGIEAGEAVFTVGSGNYTFESSI